jgi:arylformamidase
MTTAIYRHHDRASLEREYDNRAKVSAAALQRYRERWSAGSQEARETRQVRLDVAYGPSPLETLDIFGDPSASPRPVHVYIHGGYWHFGDKTDCAYVALALDQDAATTVVLNYGLAPQVPLDGQVSHCRAALRWVWNNIDDLGGDRSRLYLTGHSAGAHLAAMMLATDWRTVDATMPAQIVRGASLLSGIYDLEPVRLVSVNDQLRLSEDDARRLSPIHLPCQGDPALLVAVGELEGDEYIRQSRTLADAWRGAHPGIEFSIVPKGDHFSIRSGWEEGSNWFASVLRRAIDGRSPFHA